MNDIKKIEEKHNISLEVETDTVELKGQLPEGWKKDPRKMFKGYFALLNRAYIECNSYLIFGVYENKSPENWGIEEKSETYNRLADPANLKNFIRKQSKNLPDNDKNTIENILSQSIINSNTERLPNNKWLIIIKFSAPEQPLVLEEKYWLKKMTGVEESSLYEIQKLADANHLLKIVEKFISSIKYNKNITSFFYYLFQQDNIISLLCSNIIHDKHKIIFPVLSDIYNQLKTCTNDKALFADSVKDLHDLFKHIDTCNIVSELKQIEKIEKYIDISIKIKDIFIMGIGKDKFLELLNYNIEDIDNISITRLFGAPNNIISPFNARIYSPYHLYKNLELKDQSYDSFCKVIDDLMSDAFIIKETHYKLWIKIYELYCKKYGYEFDRYLKLYMPPMQKRLMCDTTNKEIINGIFSDNEFMTLIGDFKHKYRYLTKFKILVFDDKFYDNCSSPFTSHICYCNGFVLNYAFVHSLIYGNYWKNIVRISGTKDIPPHKNSPFKDESMEKYPIDNWQIYYRDYTYFLNNIDIFDKDYV